MLAACRFLYEEHDDADEKSSDIAENGGAVTTKPMELEMNGLSSSAYPGLVDNVSKVQAGGGAYSLPPLPSSSTPGPLGSGIGFRVLPRAQALMLTMLQQLPLQEITEQEEPGTGKDDDDDDEEDEKVLSKWGCFIWLTVVTIFIAMLSEFIVDAIKGASSALKIPMPFLCTILLPIVGNAAEHASAIIFAWKNRIEIALGVAVGECDQDSVGRGCG